MQYCKVHGSLPSQSGNFYGIKIYFYSLARLAVGLRCRGHPFAVAVELFLTRVLRLFFLLRFLTTCRDTRAHFTHVPATTKSCSTTSSPILSFHTRSLTAQTTVIDNIRFVGQGLILPLYFSAFPKWIDLHPKRFFSL